MMRLLGYLFTALLISAGVVWLDHQLVGSYLNDFLDNHFIETFAALVGFNVAAVVFLIGQIMTLEEKHGVEFGATRREIKHNSYFLLFAFVGALLDLIFRPAYQIGLPALGNLGFYLCNVLALALLGLSIFAIFEILQAVFMIGRSKPDGS